MANIFSNTIREFSPTGQDLGVFASLLGIGCPGGLAFNRSGNLLVADICSSIVREFSPTTFRTMDDELAALTLQP